MNTGLDTTASEHGAGSVTVWLTLCCAMVIAMMQLGAITRLTQSGLSITSWDPIIGVVPPLDETGWRRAFDAYRATPQYRLLNPGMTLEAFREIFFWEWLHRLWGRLIGLVFAVPLAVFWARGRIGRSLGLRLTMILALGGFQGFVGWFMVQSGLVERTSVSPIRLALHLDMAVAIYSLLLWQALAGWTNTRFSSGAGPRRHGWVAFACLVLTMTWCALVAGLQAGSMYTTWPLMADELLPAAVTAMDPIWLNPTENPAMVQFIHRWLGPFTLVMILGWVWRCRRAAPDGGIGLGLLAAATLAQVGLGLATLLSQVEHLIAVAHQAGAMTVLTLLLYNLRRYHAPATGRR